MEGVVREKKRADFGGAFAGRRVLVTGHTGFKGAWLTAWLRSMGADVVGVSLPPATTPSLFQILDLEQQCESVFQDLRDANAVFELVQRRRPEVVFHLAAQSLVRPSYEDPHGTFETNVGGTLNLLEAIRRAESVRACVIVTSDKCYENQEWLWGYRESDPMGGHDPYSASKGVCELLVSSYRRSFFASRGVHIASARAGNVIGGGDWAQDRLMTDFVTCVAQGRPLELRNPSATRPWQHVLEPLSGYLTLAQRLLGADGARFAQAWNFGPRDDASTSVEVLARRLVQVWGQGEVICASRPDQPHEAQRLALDCSKARLLMGWSAVWGVDETISRTVEWYRQFYRGDDVGALLSEQICAYAEEARVQGLPWATAP